MRELKLSKGYVTLLDDTEYDYWSQFKFCALVCKHTVYAQKWKMGLLHRLIMQAPKGVDVDHIDHNGLNNQRSNLRLATKSQNHANTKSRTGTSEYKGVYSSGGKWIARAKKDGHNYYFGTFTTEIEAGRAYDIGAIELFGSFALTNGISEDVIADPYKRRYYYYNKMTNKWQAYGPIINGKCEYLGSFDTEQEAQRAVCDFFHKLGGAIEA